MQQELNLEVNKMKLSYLILRNIKMFFKDKGLVISSLITPMILIVLYVTFLKNVYVDSFNNAVKEVNILMVLFMVGYFLLFLPYQE